MLTLNVNVVVHTVVNVLITAEFLVITQFFSTEHVSNGACFRLLHHLHAVIIHKEEV